MPMVHWQRWAPTIEIVLFNVNHWIGATSKSGANGDMGANEILQLVSIIVVRWRQAQVT